MCIHDVHCKKKEHAGCRQTGAYKRFALVLKTIIYLKCKVQCLSSDRYKPTVNNVISKTN